MPSPFIWLLHLFSLPLGKGRGWDCGGWGCYAQAYQWAKNIGSTNYDGGYRIAVDASGNVYITGYFWGTADFDPGAGITNLTSVGFEDVFFAKYDAGGNYLWAKSIGSTNDDYGRSIAIDASGNVYITGHFSDTADFDPGAGTANLTPVGGDDIFFAKYDAGGNYLWAKSIGSTNYDVGFSIAVDASGNVYITGLFWGTADFDPGAGIANLTSVDNNDIFFAKYDAGGNYLWAKNIGSTNNDVGYSIAVEASGNVYITGLFWGTADFDPGAGTANLTPVGFNDIFFAKYDAGGNYLWAKSIGSTNYDYSQSIAVDVSGNVYITGRFSGTADFDPGAGTANLTPVGGYDIFFAKYDAGGNYLWAKSIGSTNYDYGRSIAIDASGNVYITGDFKGTADFDPGAGTANLTPVGFDDIFFAKYDAGGNYLWAKSIGSTSTDYGYDIAVDASGNVYITGNFAGTADFDPGAGTANLTSVGSGDIFFANYQSVVGINEHPGGYLDNNQLKVYPNPGRGVFTIECQKSDVRCQMLEVRIFDVLGREVYKTKVQSRDNRDKINPKTQVPRGEYQIDLSGEPAGIYNVQLVGKGILLNRKVVIQ